MAVALVRGAPSLSLERKALASAIDNKVAAQAEVHAAAAAAADFNRKFESTESAYYAAIREVDKSQEYIRDLLRANGGDESSLGRHAAEQREEHPRARLRKVEEALAEVKERYALAQEGHALVEGRTSNAKRNLETTDRKCREAAAAVEVTAYRQLITESHQMYVRLFKRRQILLHLAHLFPDIHGRDRSPEAEEVGTYLDKNDRLPSLFGGDGVKTDEHRRLVQEALAPWKSAREALLLDANAPLPTDTETQK